MIRERIPGPVLVTGAAGFIGSHVAERLLSAGVDVAGIDNFDPMYDAGIKRRLSRRLEAIPGTSGAGALRMWEGDLNDHRGLADFLNVARVRGAIHLAAKAGVRPSIADPVGYVNANIAATSALMAQAQRLGWDRFVMASSSSVYGNALTVPFSEEQDVSAPISPYAATKRACELLAHTHWHLTKMPTACLRFFTVYGPRQRPDLAIQQFMVRIARGEGLTLFGEGTSRDYTYIDDIVEGVLASYIQIPAFGYRIWNLGGENPVSLDDMVGTIMQVVGRKVEIQRRGMQPGDVMRTWADLRRVKSELGYGPRTTFADGVRRQWEWNLEEGLAKA
ncbi:MAG: GDP-mannose 4,6-dehydratase [Phycisphaerales bacterium]|nr:GDP-mannose 4,6-dehydratase [Phycisphaerales bacterium]